MSALIQKWPPLGASLEVIEHHANLHVQRCPDGSAVITACPCGTTHAISCSTCAELVFVAALPGTWCVHVDAAVAA